MASLLRLPRQIIDGLAKIPNLSEEQIREIISVLESTPQQIIQRRVFDEDTASRIQSTPSGDAKLITDALFGLYMGRAIARVSIPAYVEDIVQTLREDKNEATSWTQSEEIVNQFRQRLTDLLSVDALNIITKSYDVLVQHEHIFSEARVLTDVRPIFSESVEEPPLAAVIVHMLKIEYSQDDDHKQFFVALDTKDIQILIDALNRAQSKAESLKSILSSTSVSYVEVV
jgi:hypothetical protein